MCTYAYIHVVKGKRRAIVKNFVVRVQDPARRVNNLVWEEILFPTRFRGGIEISLSERKLSLSLSLKASAIRDTNVGPGQKKIPRGKRYQRTLTRRLSILAHLTPFVRREKSFVRSVYEARGKRGSGTGWPIRKHRFVFLGYKGGRLLGREKREKKRKRWSQSSGEKKSGKAGSYPVHFWNWFSRPPVFGLFGCFVSFFRPSHPALLLSSTNPISRSWWELARFAPFPSFRSRLAPPRCDTTIVDTCTECRLF